MSKQPFSTGSEPYVFEGVITGRFNGAHPNQSNPPRSAVKPSKVVQMDLAKVEQKISAFFQPPNQKG